ncbi:MAG: DNA-directed RNA polymerase subunit omega, partial [Desulfococcaceae bacterium]
MARITIEDCLNRVPNRFVLVHMVAKRVRQIREGSEYLVSSPKNEDIVVSLREIAAGKIYMKRRDLKPRVISPVHPMKEMEPVIENLETAPETETTRKTEAAPKMEAPTETEAAVEAQEPVEA